MEQVKEAVLRRAKDLEKECSALCIDIHEHPELGFQETRSSALLVDYLTRHGFTVETGCADMPTAFRAVYCGGKPGPTIGLICEYDALPGLGHACGHNIIGTASATAAIAATAAVDALGGRVVALGTPSEEGAGGGKIRMLDAGYMDDLDCAMMFHPGPSTVLMEPSLAISSMKIRFHGKAAHAAASPHTGISALEAVIQLFVNVNGMRAHLPGDVRVNGIITNGGTVTNIIPDLCEAEFCVRAMSGEGLDAACGRLLDCAEAAAKASGCTYEQIPIGLPYRELQPCRAMVELLAGNMDFLGLPIDEKISKAAMASTDMGNVSQKIPAFHAMYGMGKVVPHTPGFAAVTGGENGAAAANNAAKALALTAVDLLADPSILQRAKAEKR